MLLAIHLLQILLSIMVSELLAICTMSFVPTVGVHRKYFVLDAQREPDSNMRETFFFFFPGGGTCAASQSACEKYSKYMG